MFFLFSIIQVKKRGELGTLWYDKSHSRFRIYTWLIGITFLVKMHYIYGLTNSLYLRLTVSHLWSVSHLLVSQKPLPEARVIGRCDRGKGGGGSCWVELKRLNQ